MKMRKMFLPVLLTVSLVLSACNGKDASAPDKASAAQQQFAAFVEEQYRYSIEDSYLAMHMYYQDPEAAGFDIDAVDICLGEVPNEENMQENRTYYASLLDALKGFDRSLLTRAQQDEYDALEWEVKSVILLNEERFDYYEQFFAPPNSLDMQIVSLLSVWDIRNERELRELVPLIDSIPGYVDDAIAYAKIQQEKQLLMTDFDKVISSCEDVLELGTDSFVLERLLDKVDEFDSIGASEREELKKEIRAAFERSYLPSFEAMRDAMEEMKGGHNNTEGYAKLPEGKDYYAAMLNYNLGTYGKSCEEFLAEFEGCVNDYFNEFRNYYLQNMDDVQNAILDMPESGFGDYTAILDHIKVEMLADFPEVKDLSYDIENADPEEKLTERNIAAYFVTPALDGDHKQHMRVNPDNDDVASLETYIVVAHEGFPGHMYQHAFFHENIESDYIKTLGVDLMVEGYAVYVMFDALDYLDHLTDADRLVASLDDMISQPAVGGADVGVNYFGWGMKELKEYFTKNQFPLEEEQLTDIYDYIKFTPVTYAPYGYGYAFISGLRETAETALGDHFDVKEFNRAILSAGPSPQMIVTRRVHEYIAKTVMLSIFPKD
ncbi:MAG: DUF885 family protein [Lachnospiraceae bacterium]|nr:DUF885 family protein [Lachnospiraceae bacterium]